ncbi:MAG TPA: hypothetical protein VNZ52_02010 [Candidatus Thermoplasmatota archaeon]|nr:hypothetical protein [Candidatus Thermoplasmatota archaeon]
MLPLSTRVKRLLYGAVMAVAGVVLTLLAYSLVPTTGAPEEMWPAIGAGLMALTGITCLLLSVFLFFVPAVLAGK